MLRAYSIGQGASTQAILGIGWIIIVGTEAMGTVREGMMVFVWDLNLSGRGGFDQAAPAQLHRSMGPFCCVGLWTNLNPNSGAVLLRPDPIKWRINTLATGAVLVRR